eukprot:SAG25_NODE_6040_length_594_cov_1.224242_1_plen_146_part_10
MAISPLVAKREACIEGPNGTNTNARIQNPTPSEICEYVLPTSAQEACLNIGDKDYEGVMFKDADKIFLSAGRRLQVKNTVAPPSLNKSTADLCKIWAKVGRCRGYFRDRMDQYCNASLPHGVDCDAKNPKAARSCVSVSGTPPSSE